MFIASVFVHTFDGDFALCITQAEPTAMMGRRCLS
jgi:hypothetical protein